MRKEEPISMTTLKKGKRIFGPLFLVCRLIWRITHKRQPVFGMENIGELPAVFIGRHQNMYGPVEIMAWVPMKFKVWTLYKFLSVKECYQHYSSYTYPVSKGFGPLASKISAMITAPLVAAFMRSMGGIPVYRGRKNIIDTFRQSVAALAAGESLLIMPERDYQDSSSDAGELYNGFVHLAQMYYRSTGKALCFYPIYPSRENRQIYVEKPVVFDPSQPFRAERDRVIEALMKELNHRVIEKDFNTEIADGTTR
jgi:1-acyl-sn-glycerol-3-phosphate acyltransferase